LGDPLCSSSFLLEDESHPYRTPEIIIFLPKLYHVLCQSTLHHYAAMVITGAMRSVAVKIFFQMGFEKPYFVTMLFHIAGLPAFVVHYLYGAAQYANDVDSL
jgi:hypothetical protein